MNAISQVSGALAKARTAAALTQRELAQRARTAQSVVARIERGQANPTIGTLERLLDVAGFELRVEIVPKSSADPIVDAYKRDVDRTLLRENLRRGVSERLAMNAELQTLTRAMRGGLRAGRKRP